MAPTLNTEVVNVFLQQLSRELNPEVIAIVIWDQAGFHTSGKLLVPDNIIILRLPPYSPELNPIENLWHYLKSHFWSNRFYATYDALIDAAQDAWQKVCLDSEKIKTICAVSYI